ncbi:MAG: hypothetical protein EOL88_14900 [Bacteroidia bacterium]|nr:hypothetical protein [Bacteroidia bacterium]
MTIKEAILKSLEDLNSLTNYSEIYEHIVLKKYYDFKDAKTPASTVSALLGDFIRLGDARVKRIKQPSGTFSYYLTKNEASLDLESAVLPTIPETKKPTKIETFEERDLHKLLSSFLKTTDIYSKTIFHEQSNRSDEHQKWIHPDLVGIKFLKLQTNASQTFLKAINRVDTFKISSYEIKKEINSDYELKKSFFQAVSNSSWANYGFLVAFEISDNLTEEMERLNQSFGIGIIELKANPYESKILFQPKYKDLDFKTIDKLCKINKEFEKFVEQTEKLMTASDKYIKATEKELDEFCDRYFLTDTEVEKYCKEKHIPIENNN